MLIFDFLYISSFLLIEYIFIKLIAKWTFGLLLPSFVRLEYTRLQLFSAKGYKFFVTIFRLIIYLSTKKISEYFSFKFLKILFFYF